MALSGTIESNYKVYLYDIESVVIVCNGETFNMSDLQISDAYIERNYDEDYLPIFMLKLMIPDDLYYNIVKNHDKTTFTIMIKNMIYENESKKTDYSIWLNGIYQPMGVDGTPFVAEDLFDDVKKTTGSESGMDLSDFSRGRTFILAKASDLNVSKAIVNAILTSANMTTAVSYVMSQAGVTNMLMSPLDNNESYRELVLLPQPLIPQLKYLNSFYGFYKEGAQIFFDIDSGYILRNTHACTAYRSREVTTVVITLYDTSTPNSMNSGSFIDRPALTAYLGVNAGRYSIEDRSKSSGQYLGSDSMIIDNDGNISGSSGTSTNVLTTKNHNKFYKDEISLRMEELSHILILTCYNVDMRLFKPNKCFKVVSNSTKITQEAAGMYRLVSTKCRLTRSGDHHSAVATITLAKTST